MRLRQVLATGIEGLPDEGDCAHPEYLCALIGQKEHLLRHVVESGRVGVHQVPWVGMESGLNPGLQVVILGKSARVFIRENFSQSAFIGVRQDSIRENPIELTIVEVAAFGALSPVMLVRGAVDD